MEYDVEYGIAMSAECNCQTWAIDYCNEEVIWVYTDVYQTLNRR